MSVYQCPKCYERRVVISCYTRKDGTRGRCEFCLSGCGYKRALPTYEQMVAQQKGTNISGIGELCHAKR